MLDLELQADLLEELRECLNAEYIDEANWAFIEAQEN